MRLDLLLSVDDPAVDEVTQPLRLRGGEGRRSPIRRAPRAARRTATASPLEAPVTVEVRAHIGATRIRLAVLAPGPVRAGRDVVLTAVRIHVGHDPELACVDQVGDPGVGAIVV